jgi:hypothetical protein
MGSTETQTPPPRFSFIGYRPNPLRSGVFCEDLAIYRPQAHQLESHRISVYQNRPRVASKHVERRGSALTEMMKASLERDSDLGVEHAERIRWSLPFGDGLSTPMVESPMGATRPVRAPIGR